MKKIVFIALVLLSAKGFSQNLADSIYIYQQSQNNIAVYQNNATFLLANTIEKIGFSKIFYQTTNGGFRLAQQAQQNTNAGVYSEGITKFKRFASSGYFGFNRTWQDSLSWSTKGLEQDDQPYYYGSVKAGKFERLNYSLGGILTYDLIKDKLTIAGGAEYFYNSATRSVDPRPTVNTFQLLLKPELVYHFNTQLLGLKTTWGYGTETMSVSFKNRDFQASTTGYPDRVNYLIQGYGLISNAQGTTRSIKRMDKFFRLGLNYSGIFSNYSIKASVGYESKMEDNYQDLSESIKRGYFSYYDTEILRGYAQFDKSGNQTDQQLSLNYSQQNSNDINVMFYAVNYRYFQELATVNYLIRLKNYKKISPEFGATLNYVKVDKTDYATAHLLSYTWLTPAISTNVYIKLNKADQLTTGLTLGYRKPFKNQLSVPLDQQTVFTRGVVFPDFSYYTSSALRLEGKINYITGQLFKQFKTGVSSKIIYYRKLDDKFTSPVATHVLGNQLVDVNFSLNLYF